MIASNGVRTISSSVPARALAEEPSREAVGLQIFENEASLAPIPQLSQKELAAVLMITARHLRRIELKVQKRFAETTRPYTSRALWQIFKLRGRRGWDASFAAQVGIADLLSKFEALSIRGEPDRRPFGWPDLFLEAIADDGTAPRTTFEALPKSAMGEVAGLAKSRLRSILANSKARRVLIGAFFEASLLADDSPSH